MKLHIARGFTLPLDAVTQTFAIIAKRGSGKTYTASVHAEEFLTAKAHIVILDPTGAWWGLRATRDGSPGGFQIPILGGEHGDLPLESGAGETIANFVIDNRISVVLDLELFRKNEQARFVTDFLETLYRRNRYPVHVFIDEADAFAPQRPMHGEERMLGAVEDIVRRGRKKGIGVTLITQRSAVLNKNVLTQAEAIIALRTISPQDQEALEAWIKAHGTPEKRELMMASMASLPRGTAWYWAPGWPEGTDGIFQQVKVRERKTYNSSATPKPGEARREPKTLADVDLGQLKTVMMATIERAKKDDPRELRKRIAQLEAEARKRIPTKALADDQRVEKMMARNDALQREVSALEFQAKRTKTGLRKLTEEWGKARAEAERGWKMVSAAMERVEKTMPDMSPLTDAVWEAGKRDAEKWSKVEGAGTPVSKGGELTLEMIDKATADFVWAKVGKFVPSRGRLRDLAEGDLPDWDGKVVIGEKRILTAIAQHHPDGVTREQLTVLTGYTRSSRNTYLQRLRQRGHVEEFATDGRIRVTEEGIKFLGSEYEPLPTGSALREYWLGKLGGGEQKILDALCKAYPDAVDREALTEMTGYTRSSRNTYLQRLRARELIHVDVDGPGTVKASQTLFD